MNSLGDRVPLQPRWLARKGMDGPQHLRAVDDAQDEFNNAIVELRHEIKTLNRVLVGVLATTASGSIMLALNLFASGLSL